MFITLSQHFIRITLTQSTSGLEALTVGVDALFFSDQAMRTLECF